MPKNLLGFSLPDEDEQLNQEPLTPGTSAQVPKNMPVPLQALTPKPTPAPMPTALPPQAPAPVAPQAMPQKPLPGMPPSVTPDMLASYLGRQKGAMDKYGPEEQMKLQQSLDARRNSLGYKVKDAGKGFADALMMGVAGAGNPGWQNSFENQENQMAAEKMNTLQKANEGNLQRVGTSMKLDQMDPNSDLSKASQESYAPLFKELGYPPEKIKNMSAANIDSTMSLMTQYGGAKVQAMIKQYELEIERARLAASMGKQESEDSQAKEKQKADAASELLRRSQNARFLGVPIPFTSDVSGPEAQKAKQVLMDQLKGGTTEQASSFNHEEIPSGQVYQAPDGTWRRKK